MGWCDEKEMGMGAGRWAGETPIKKLLFDSGCK
jgi:hypothetical protein